MSWYAVSAIEDAIEVTREFLFPFDLSKWLRLAVIVFFLGGLGVSSPVQSGMQFSPGSNEPVQGPPGGFDISPDTVLTVFVVLFVIAVFLGLLFTLIGSVMEFALVESLRSREVHVRDYMGNHFGQGFRLFVFRVVLFLIVLAPIAVIVLLTVPALLGGSGNIALGTFFLFLPVFFVLGLIVALVDGFTRSFVVPVMIVRERGVLAGWSAFWPTLRREWKQYGVYLVLKFFIGIAVGFLVSIAAAIVFVILLVPFGIVGALLAVAFGGFASLGTTLATPVGIAVFGLLVLAYVLCAVFFLALVRVPIRTYIGYFSLLVLGDTNEEFDLIPTFREKIR